MELVHLPTSFSSVSLEILAEELLLLVAAELDDDECPCVQPKKHVDQH